MAYGGEVLTSRRHCYGGMMDKTYSEQLQDEIEPIHREDNRTDLESVDARQ